MAAATKAAAFLAMLRVFYVPSARPVGLASEIGTIAMITMLRGAVVAISQTDVKRMLAYSSIAHAGFLLVGFVGVYAGARPAPTGSPRCRASCST